MIAKEPKVGKEQSAKYHVENQKGAQLVWGSAVLDDRMQHVQIGDGIKIVYEGQKELAKDRKLNLYRVYVAEDTE